MRAGSNKQSPSNRGSDITAPKFHADSWKECNSREQKVAAGPYSEEEPEVQGETPVKNVRGVYEQTTCWRHLYCCCSFNRGRRCRHASRRRLQRKDSFVPVRFAAKHVSLELDQACETGPKNGIVIVSSFCPHRSSNGLSAADSRRRRSFHPTDSACATSPESRTLHVD
jgi:hypothetical protein